MWILLAPALASSYTLSFPERHAQRVAVEAELTAAGPETGLFMATWTPGSYLIREYARHVEGLEAKGPDGAALAVRKSSKNRWIVDTDGVKTFTLHYTLYAAEISVRGNFVDQDLAVLNGAPTYIVLDDLEGPYDIRVDRPDGWAQTISTLPEAQGRFSAASYDLLVDTPMVVGNPKVTEFEVGGVPHALVDFPANDDWDSDKAAAAVKRSAEAQLKLWGSFPYERYLFLNWVADSGRGGLEHLDSTLMITHRDRTREDEAFESWLGLVSHEHFHAWNVKRLRPESLGPFDYQNEVYTRDLWIAEGFTSYYDDLLLARAGLIDEEEWLERMGKNLSRLESTPGRLEQPVSQASYDAWIKHYRPDANSLNTSISYYTKGAVIGWMIDALIRRESRGKASLDDAMRLAYTRFSGDQGYTSEAFREVLAEAAGADIREPVAQWADTATELDLSATLEWFGLKRVPPEDLQRKTWLGLNFRDGRVSGVVRDGPGWRAGVQADDEVLAIDSHRLGDLEPILARYEPGAKVEVLISRRGQLRTFEAKLGKEPVKLELVRDPKNKKGLKRLLNLLD